MSPKNKGKFGKSKSDVEETDEFLSGVQRLGRFLRPHAKKLAIAGAVITLGVFGLVFYSWLKDGWMKDGTQKYMAATDIMNREVVAPEEPKPDEPAPDPTEPPTTPPIDPADDPEADKAITYATLAAKAEAELAAIDALKSDAGRSPAAKRAELLKARALLDLDRYDEAAATYRAYAGAAHTELLKVLAREGVGYSLEAKAMAQTDAAAREAGLKEALDAFQKMQPDEAGLRRKHALYHEARIHATLGDQTKALELYKKILEVEPPADLEETVNARIAALEAGGAKAPAPGPPPDGDGDGGETPEPGSEGGE